MITRFKEDEHMSRWAAVPEPFILIDTDRCTGCGSCVTVCGGDVLELEKHKALVARMEDCLECGTCEVVCPVDAIRYRVPAGGTGIIYECG